MSLLSVSAIENTGSPTTNIVVNADGSVTIGLYRLGVAPTPVQTGTLWYDQGGVSGTTGVVIWDGAAWVGVGGGAVSSVSATAPIASSGGANPNISATLADAATAAAGTSNVVLSTPAFSVPKDAANMTGAAILPSGTNTQRAAITPLTVGMQRYNTDSGYEEVYTGATNGWRKINWVPIPDTLPPDLSITANQSLSGPIVCNNLTIAAGITINLTGTTLITCYGNATIGACTILGDGTGSNGGGGFTTNSNTLTGGNTGTGIGAGSGNIGGVPAGGLFAPGAGGAAGFVADSPFFVSNGGKGGAAFGIKAYGDITFNGAVIVSVNGGAGQTSLGSAGGGGGAGGSLAYIAQGTLNMNGTHSAQGGSGGSGNGGTLGTAGGGGGSGGVIYLYGTKGIVGGYTTLLTQGPAGANSGAAQVGGGGGGGNGSVGGGSAAGGGTAGGPGYVSFAPPVGL
jgi:hypothetical protein